MTTARVRAAGHGTSAGAGSRSWRMTVAWVACLTVVVIAHGFGTLRPTGTQTITQRAAAIDAVVRCPSCESLSVADSTAATAVAVRAAVLSRLRAGQSAAHIEQFLVSRYGQAILLRPPTNGTAGLVWAVPVVALVLGAGGLAVVFWRRRDSAPAAVDDEDRAIVDAALAGPP